MCRSVYVVNATERDMVCGRTDRWTRSAARGRRIRHSPQRTAIDRHEKTNGSNPHRPLSTTAVGYF